MATILELASSGGLFKLDAGLGVTEQEWRHIYVLPDLERWLQSNLPTLGSTWDIEQSPLEQFDAFAWIYCSGQTLTFGNQFKPLNHLGDGIWELKTADLRIFGWFPKQDQFIGTDANLTDDIKRLRMYRPYAEQAIRRRDGLDLDEPKFIDGDDPHDVVSNYDLPEP